MEQYARVRSFATSHPHVLTSSDSKNRALISSHPSHQWRLGLATPKSGDALTMRTDTKTDSNQALLKPIVGIIVGIVKNNNQEMP